jgi:hypothetical protein
VMLTQEQDKIAVVSIRARFMSRAIPRRRA